MPADIKFLKVNMKSFDHSYNFAPENAIFDMLQFDIKLLNYYIANYGVTHPT